MISFSTYNGDVVVGETIEMVSDTELLRQKVARVVGTNQGEWTFDKEEGIDFRAILIKNPDKDEIRATIEAALARIDETLTITEFDMVIDRRVATISFKAVNGEGEEVGGGYTYGGQ
jgi:hypothetical protein